MIRILSANRLLFSWILATLCMASYVATGALFQPNTWQYIALAVTGHLLVVVCALGRLYATAFIGGHKTSTLVTYGPFSVVRNPLYVFSFIGVLGIGLLSMSASVLIIAPAGAAMLFASAVIDEERALLERFGQEYLSYFESVPRFMPALRKYRAPETVLMHPVALKSGAIDAFYWFLAIPGLLLLHAFGQ
jgi:protein-S-isoprenylcysteine O-methyltransferase Ste14